MSFEMLNRDTDRPEVIHYYIVDMDRTFMYFRVSSSESVLLYYMLTLKGKKYFLLK